jgi:hypothetical protein
MKGPQLSCEADREEARPRMEKQGGRRGREEDKSCEAGSRAEGDFAIEVERDQPAAQNRRRGVV